MADSPDDKTAVHDSGPGRPATVGTQSIEIPGYRIIQRLGEGGMGAVFLAEELALGRQVAIKVVSDAIARDPQIRARFLREARLLATVEHPNVVRVYTFGEIEERAYLVMEFVEGETLADRIRRTGPMPAEDALAAVHSIADALATAWEEHVIHRDIKPSNILYDKRGRLRVADFGLAKGVESATDSSLTQAGYLLGSPHYVAPEQAQGHDADFRSDIYSLGIVLFEMITGRKPYEGTTAVAVVAKHLHEPLPDVRSYGPHVPDEIADLIEWMTAKSPENRPQSYAELLTCLRSESLTPSTPIATHATAHGAKPPKAPLAAIVVGVIFVLALVFFVQRRASRPHGAQHDERVAVAIAPFYGPDAESLKEGRFMASMIEKAVASKLGDDVRVIGADAVGDPIRDHDAARAVGERLGASAVIWGEAYALRRETEIQPSVTMIPRKKKADALSSAQAGDPFLAMQAAPAALRVGSDAGNQVEMRKTSAEGIGDLVTFVVATHALRELNDPRKAFELLSQMRVTADSHFHKALARVVMREDAAAARELAAALQLDPQHAQALALMADIDIRSARWSDAIAHLAAAKATGRAFTATEGAPFGGKLYVKERYENQGKSIETANLLGIDPGTGHVIERYRLSGIARAFEPGDDALVIRYDIGRTDQLKLEAVRFANGVFDPPPQPPAHLLVRLQSVRPGWAQTSNFTWALSVRANKIARPTFSLDPVEASRDPRQPMTLQDLRAALEKNIARDPTLPGPHAFLGMTLWELGDRAGAERAFMTATGDGFPGVPYYDYSWMARQLEPYGHHRWADRAYEQARKRRALLRDPVSTSLMFERLINAPFVRGAAFASSFGGDPKRQHLWLQRTREINGLMFESEELGASAWARWFRAQGDVAAAEREEAIARRAAGISTYFDWLGLVDLGFPAILAFGVMGAVTLVVSLVRAARRGAVLGRITRGERIAILACLAIAIVLTLAQLAAFRKMALFSLIPIGLNDSLGSPLTAMTLDETLAENPSDDLRFAAAVSHHLAGHGSRATALYRRVAGRDGVADNLDALRQNKPPVNAPSAEQVTRAILRMGPRMLFSDAISVFRSGEPGNDYETRLRTGSKIFLGLMAALLILVAVFSTVPVRDPRRTFGALRWSVAAALILFAILAWTVHVKATSKSGRPAPGILSANAMPPLTHVFPLPPMPNSDEVERDAWNRSTAMRTFRVAVYGSAGVALLLIAAGPVLSRRRDEKPITASG